MKIKEFKNKLMVIVTNLKAADEPQRPAEHLNLGETPEERANAIRMKALQHCFGK